MLILQPRLVRFGPTVLENVSAVAIARSALQAVVEWGDGGPHAVFADVPRQKLTITVRQTLAAGDPADLVPGSSGAFILCTAPAESDAGRRKLSASVVLLSAESDLRPAEPRGPAAGLGVRTLTFVALSPDGAADPLTVTDAGAEA